MISKKIIMASSMVLLLSSCAHEEYHVGPLIGINLGEVKKALSDNTPKFKKCFQSEFQGSTHLNFTVNEKGHVAKSEIETNEGEAGPAKDCMKTVLEGIKFPAPVNAKSYDVSQPIDFKRM